MSTESISTPAELMPLCWGLLYRAARKDERTPIVRSGERDPISGVLRHLVYRRDRWRCVWCGASPWAADKDRRCSMLHLDHITPWSAGGPDRSDNLRTLCDSCNGYRSNYRVDMATYVALPIVGQCATCLGVIGAKPPSAFTVYCACRHHESWVIPGWHIL